jgi:hypothetical protein
MKPRLNSLRSPNGASTASTATISWTHDTLPVADGQVPGTPHTPVPPSPRRRTSCRPSRGLDRPERDAPGTPYLPPPPSQSLASHVAASLLLPCKPPARAGGLRVFVAANSFALQARGTSPASTASWIPPAGTSPCFDRIPDFSQPALPLRFSSIRLTRLAAGRRAARPPIPHPRGAYPHRGSPHPPVMCGACAH